MKISNQAGKVALLAAGLAGMPAAMAAEGLSYAFVELDYINQDVDQANESGIFRDDFDNGGGYGLKASLPIAERFYVFGNYFNTESDFSFVNNENVVIPGDTDVKRLEVGAGFILPASPTSDVLLSAGYTDIDYGSFNLGAGSSIRPADLDDDPSDGFLLDVSWRAQLTDRVEGRIGGRYTEIEEVNGLSLVGNVMYEFTPNVGVNLSVDAGEELLTWGLGARYSF